MLKTCTKCGDDKPNTAEFFPTFRCRKGTGRVYLSGRCRKCHSKAVMAAKESPAARARRLEKHYERRRLVTRDAENAARRAKRQADRIAKLIAARGEHAVRAELVPKLVSLIQSRLIDPVDWPAGKPTKAVCWLWENPSLTDAEQYRLRYRTDPDFNIQERMRRQIRKKAKRDGIGDIMREALNRGGESGKVVAVLGYTIADLRRHLERQFLPGMSWQHFMSGAIHIDHIVPQSEFDLSDDCQWRKCWCLSNLRPLWAGPNLQKSNRLEFLL